MTKKVQVALLLLFASFKVDAQNIVINAGHVFDSRNDRLLSNQTIIIGDGKIKEVGANPKISKADSVIDLSDPYVLPGLMECHVHITSNLSYRQRNRNDVNVTESNSLRAIRGSLVARQFLENGFTTITEIVNDANYATAGIVKAIKKEWIQGPTIIYAGKIIAPYGGQSTNINPGHEHFWDLKPVH